MFRLTAVGMGACRPAEKPDRREVVGGVAPLARLMVIRFIVRTTASLHAAVRLPRQRSGNHFAFFEKG